MSAPLKHVPAAEYDKNDPKQKLGTVLDVILAEFDKLGYKTVYGILDAVNYGVPQFRERFVCHFQRIFKCTKTQNIDGKQLGRR